MFFDGCVVRRLSWCKSATSAPRAGAESVLDAGPVESSRHSYVSCAPNMRVCVFMRAPGFVLLGIAVAVALYAAPCSSASALSSGAGSFAGHGAGFPSTRQAHASLSGDPTAGLHGSGREGRAHGRPALDEEEDSLQEMVNSQLKGVEELLSRMSQFQVPLPSPVFYGHADDCIANS